MQCRPWVDRPGQIDSRPAASRMLAESFSLSISAQFCEPAFYFMHSSQYSFLTLPCRAGSSAPISDGESRPGQRHPPTTSVCSAKVPLRRQNNDALSRKDPQQVSPSETSIDRSRGTTNGCNSTWQDLGNPVCRAAFRIMGQTPGPLQPTSSPRLPHALGV